MKMEKVFFPDYEFDITSFSSVVSTPSEINFSFSFELTKSVWEDNSLQSVDTSHMENDVSVTLPQFGRYRQLSKFIKDKIKYWPFDDNDQVIKNMISKAHRQAQSSLKSMPRDHARVDVRCRLIARHRFVFRQTDVTGVDTTEINPGSCCICLEECSEFGGSMPCKHVFHQDCIEKWLKDNCSCPICRFQISAPRHSRCLRTIDELE